MSIVNYLHEERWSIISILYRYMKNVLHWFYRQIELHHNSLVAVYCIPVILNYCLIVEGKTFLPYSKIFFPLKKTLHLNDWFRYFRKSRKPRELYKLSHLCSTNSLNFNISDVGMEVDVSDSVRRQTRPKVKSVR